MVSGKPYISTKSATMKAEKPPKVRQSRFVFGLKKLNANKMKIAELMITSDHNPYASMSFPWLMMFLLLLGGGEHYLRAPNGPRCFSP